MKYRYIKFADNVHGLGKRGKLTFVGEPSPKLMDELSLTIIPGSSSYNKTYYVTTLSALGEKGWELQCVTPCGVKIHRNGTMGQIENAYVFRKQGEE